MPFFTITNKKREDAVKMKDKLIVALDVPGRQQALHFVDILREEVGCFKIGIAVI